MMMVRVPFHGTGVRNNRTPRSDGRRNRSVVLFTDGAAGAQNNALTVSRKPSTASGMPTGAPTLSSVVI